MNQPRHLAASVRQRLLNLAQAQREDFNLVLTRFTATVCCAGTVIATLILSLSFLLFTHPPLAGYALNWVIAINSVLRLR